ncbi:MAG: glycerol-3-phosphate 1-O-acyltransferase PlsY [Armatimonadetes bacterium]|nr:glycerol-3-phosphate 1-O-acyltransferase PlsY [Armatimonadota bacterium]
MNPLLPWGLMLLSYFIGSIPIGVLVAKAKGIDITQVGSGNVGATNVARVLGKGPGLAVFLLDVAKGLVPCLLATNLTSTPVLGMMTRADFAFVCGVLAMLGHMFSPFLKFKGGKGIATGLGMLFGAAPLVAVAAFGVFLVLMAITRIVSLSSIVATVVMVTSGFILSNSIVGSWVLLAVGTFVLVKHIPNMKRLREGTESKFSFGSKKSEQGEGGQEGEGSNRES